MHNPVLLKLGSRGYILHGHVFVMIYEKVEVGKCKMRIMRSLLIRTAVVINVLE